MDRDEEPVGGKQGDFENALVCVGILDNNLKPPVVPVHVDAGGGVTAD